MGIVQQINKRTYMQTAAGVADLSQYLARSYPLQTAAIRALDLHDRENPYKKTVSIDLAYIMDGLFMDDGGLFAHVRDGFRNGETVKILCTRSDAEFWVQADFILPNLSENDDADFFPFSINAEAAGENQYQGTLLNYGTVNSISITDMPVGGYGLIAIEDVGALTSVRLRYTSGGTNYDHLISSPVEGLHIAQLQTSGNATIPSSRSSGFLTVTPFTAIGKVVLGYGKELEVQ